MTDPSQIAAIGKAEFDHFLGSKTLKLVVAFVVASTSAYVQGLVAPTPGADPPVTFKVWLAAMVASAVSLTIRHALAGIEAKQDVDAGRVAAPPEPKRQD